MKKSNFWSLINQYSIEIPTIQRDYTYGRKSVQDIKKQLVTKLLTVEESVPLHLDFIYGRLQGKDNFNLLDRNKQSIDTLLSSLSHYAKSININVQTSTEIGSRESADNITFIPLDGQQRLTTLFLLHWYIAIKLAKKEALKILSNFSYATRQSSTDFLAFITQKFELPQSDDTSIRDLLEGHEHFFVSWKKDPTVHSCLVVIEEVAQQIKEHKIDIVTLWDKLTQTPLVTFDFFDLDDFDQTDELYVKMNARGKKLSDFENFKAWLIKNFKDNPDIEQIEAWQKKLDITWNDYFWDNKLASQTETDTAYLSFFKEMYLGDYVGSIKDETEGEEAIQSLISDDLSCLKAVFDKDKAFSKYLATYFNFLDVQADYFTEGIAINKAFIGGEFILSNIFFSKANDPKAEKKSIGFNWWHRAFYFSVSRYIIRFKEIEDKKNDFQHYIRLVSNLIYNTTIDTPELYKSAISSITNILNELEEKNIQIFLSNNSENITFFDTAQIEEEKKKNALVVEDSKWRELLTRAENIHYLYGQIHVIFDLAKEGDKVIFEKFLKYTEIVEKVFDDTILSDSTYLLFRNIAIHASNDEELFIKKGANKGYPLRNSSGTLRTRNENWRHYFKEEEKLTLLKKVLDSLKDGDDIKTTLTGNLTKYTEKTAHEYSFRYTIIKTPDVLAYSKKNLVRKIENGYYLMNSTQIHGKYRELYTYAYTIEKGKKDIHRESKTINGLDNTGIALANEKDIIYFDRHKACFVKKEGEKEIKEDKQLDKLFD